MLTLFYGPGACSMAPHIVLEESGEKYAPKKLDLAKGEQRTPEYLKIHPLGRVPALLLDDGSPLTENTAILPYLGKRFGLWPADPVKEARALSVIGFFAATVHPANGHIGRAERYTDDKTAFPGIQAKAKSSYREYMKRIDALYAGREWLADSYSVLDPYAFVFYFWHARRGEPVAELKHYTAARDRMLERPAVQRVVADENVKL
ncbi:MAG: glutathione S-transferase family protein [Betaproteobacteria bacterium]|nr:glutathione S-transferase family protein [Betaproteobacteria bacterium]